MIEVLQNDLGWVKALGQSALGAAVGAVIIVWGFMLANKEVLIRFHEALTKK